MENKTIEQLRHCYDYAEDIELSIELRQDYWNRIEQANANANNLLSKSDTMRTCKRIALAASIIAPLMLISSLSAVHSAEDAVSFVTSIIIPFVIVPIFLTFWFRKKEKTAIEQHKKAKQEAEEYAVSIQSSILECEEDIKDAIFAIQREGLFEIMPKDFFYTDAIAYCIKLFENKLVTNMHEAMVALHNEIQRQEQFDRQEAYHNMQMEKMDDLTKAVNINTMVTWIESQNNRD